MNKALAIIPARYASTRFPGKPLADIHGKSMIMRVYEQVMKAGSVSGVLVATDDQRIYNHVIANSGKVVMTSVQCNSGTERCLEAYEQFATGDDPHGSEIIVNVQGDEPFIKPEQIDLLVKTLDQPLVGIATLVKKIENREDFNDPNCVKVVFDRYKRALYFSRAPVPYQRDSHGLSFEPAYKHIGMYAYRYSILRQICSLPPSGLEKSEKLEQLRWLENGHVITIQITEHESIAIDTPSDLLKVTNIA